MSPVGSALGFSMSLNVTSQALEANRFRLKFRQALMQKCVEPLSGVFRACGYRHWAVCF
jgi:hypothetical protein